MTEGLEQVNTCDALVIGSSPLMLMRAYYLAGEGKSVVVVDKDEIFGGAWRNYRLNDQYRVEIGCHLIEAYPKVYDVYNNEFDIPFEVCTPQPARILKSGKVIRYFSMPMVVLSTIRVTALYFLSLLKSILDRNQIELVKKYASKLRDYRNQFLGVICGCKLEDPVHGYSHFIERLIEKCEENGVNFIRYDVKSMQRKNDKWVATDTEGKHILSRDVICSSSACFEKTSDNGFFAKDAGFILHTSIVCGVKTDDLLVSRSYTAFWNDPFVKRISLLIGTESPNGDPLFLLEITGRVSDYKIPQFNSLISDAFVKAQLTKSNVEIEVLEVIENQSVNNTDQLPIGEIAPRFHTISSYGNLASGILGNRKWIRTKAG
ncbi:MAG: NAD(P)-binding protein [Rhodothermales bacterium]